MQLLSKLAVGITQAINRCGFPNKDLEGQIRQVADAKFGDYQFNGAMGLAKELGLPPREVAVRIAEHLSLPDILATVEVAGPGFLNLRLRNDWLSSQLQTMGASDCLGVGRVNPPLTYVIDFSSPNVAKPMHVGHLRSTIIGDSIARVLRFLGHKVITDNHLGDWGTQFGIILHGFKNQLNQENFAKDPVGELARLYVEVRKQFKTEESEDQTTDPVQEACRNETAKLHHGDEENRRLWQQFMPLCLKEIQKVYDRLDIHFDHTHGESHYQPFLHGVVESLEKQGLAVETDGAMGVFLKEGQPPALVRKRDGAFTYMTTDLATIQSRVQENDPAHILYVVDSRQAFHFQQLFEIARTWLKPKAQLHHVSFGSVLGPDRRPIKTRSGDAVASLDQLLDEATRLAREVNQSNSQPDGSSGEAPEEDAAGDAEVIGIGAVKYADLSQNRTSDYVFNWEKMVAMDGNTATYMQYAYARNRSIFRKGGIDMEKFRIDLRSISLETAEERQLGMQLFRFLEAVQHAGVDYRPNVLTSYLWDLAKAYSIFFQNCPVLKAESEALKMSRLGLCDLTARVLKTTLDLLGIRVLEKM